MFRVTGLPASQPNDALNETLKATISDNLSEEERSKLKISTDIVPSCYDNEEGKLCASEVPRRRSYVPVQASTVGDPLANWQVEMGDTDISFDCHFFGFTQLYKPNPEAPVVAE